MCIFSFQTLHLRQSVGNLDALELVFRLISSSAHLEVRSRALRCIQVRDFMLSMKGLRSLSPLHCAGASDNESVECGIMSQSERVFLHAAESG